MALTKLKEVPQELWLGSKGYSKNGICFYMSEYVELTTWQTGTYDGAKTAASSSVPNTIMKSGKAKNLSDRDRSNMLEQWKKYVDQAFNENTIYRIALWFGNPVGAPAEDADPLKGRNHAAVAASGGTGTVLFFEPNFGFYEAVDATKDRKTLLEESINGLYAASGDTAKNFIYLKGRKMK